MSRRFAREQCIAFLSALALAGCADGDSGAGRTQNAPIVRTGGAGAGTAGSGGSGDFGNGMPRAGSPAVMMQPPMQTPGAAGGVLEPVTIDQCAARQSAGLDPATVQKLMAGGAPGNLRMLYPYDGTVFPRGLLAPLLMWDGGSGDAEAVYVHIKASKFEYKGCLKPSAAGQLQLPQDVWDTAGEQTQGPGDPFVVELTLLAGGTVERSRAAAARDRAGDDQGLDLLQQLQLALPAAPGDPMQGAQPAPGVPAIPGVPGLPGVGGSVLRIPPGGTAERFVSIECNGCHSVSANGTRLAQPDDPHRRRARTALAPDTPANPPRDGAGAARCVRRAVSGRLGLPRDLDDDRVARSSADASIGAEPAATLFETDTGAERRQLRHPRGRADADVLARRNAARRSTTSRPARRTASR